MGRKIAPEIGDQRAVGGWVENDKRLKQIVLTDEAKTLHADIVKEIEHFETTMRRGFKEEEVDKLLSFIDRIKTNLEEAQKGIEGDKDHV